MTLSSKELGNLMSLLTLDQCANNTFENIGQQVQKYFTKQDGFKVGTALVLLLQNPDLLPNRMQQLVALYLLWELTRVDPPNVNPFQPAFVYAMRSDENDTRHFRVPCLPLQERVLLYSLLQSTHASGQPSRELLKKTPQQIANSVFPPNVIPSELDLSFLESPYAERAKEMPVVSRVAMPCVLSDPERRLASMESYSGSGSSAEAQRQVLDSLLTGDQAAVRSHLRPEFLLLAPPLHSVGIEDELVWMSPTGLEHTAQWDASMCQSGSSGAETRKLMVRAFKQTLQQSQIRQLNEAISQDPKLISLSGMSPSRLPELVEHNPLVAIEVLLTLMKASSPQVTDYFSVLVNMEMSLHSMEVVNRLTTSVELPAEFIHLYISNCISSCESTKDKYMQNRLVRLVCVFLQSLIRNKIIDVKNIYIEVQAFCIEFNRIREAAGLFRLLKSLESSDGSVDSAAASAALAAGGGGPGSNPPSAATTPSKP
ncbi:hypothetical protein BOX15_Mlig004161g2 [Macrostomum lignano]|uniref:Uncharacterized protein n=2 Tax=Macrostomum lignano TaxID=282301 RepID=A0A267GUN3_9PLAT|nr:hypothetical protein BOX15_Mlig004161g2 [Macrostomum lignano]